jgi:putative transposase
MTRARKVHVQTNFAFRTPDRNGHNRGGKRKGAGRKARRDDQGRRRMAHATRPAIDKRHPQHITLRVAPELGWLRRLDVYAALRVTLRTMLAHAATFRVVHFSLQNTHLHLIVEASDKAALTLGMRAFQISAAKRINAMWSRRRQLLARRRGVVFMDRYHAEDLRSVRQVRNTLSYVLNNWRRHRVDCETSIELCAGHLDPYASGQAFPGWSERMPAPGRLPRDYESAPTSAPRTWLLSAGWTKARPISCFEVPGPRPRTSTVFEAMD